MGSLPADKITLHRKCCVTFILNICTFQPDYHCTADLEKKKKKLTKVERIEVGISFGILICQYVLCNFKNVINVILYSIYLKVTNHFKISVLLQGICSIRIVIACIE